MSVFTVFTALKDRRQAIAARDEAARAAQPGEVWTSSYRTDEAVYGGPFESWTAGTVRTFGDEYPVEERRGMTVLGEDVLTPQTVPGWFRLLFVDETAYTLVPGDTAPVVTPGIAADLLAVPEGAQVLVEHRSTHAVYLGLRFVERGRAGRVKDFLDGDGPGRYVGDSWVRLADVTGVQTSAGGVQ